MLGGAGGSLQTGGPDSTILKSCIYVVTNPCSPVGLLLVYTLVVCFVL